ncbi:unnamed protein product [Vitrella brassicaformis CCMP3155]|uniref:Major facilitator superfamily (MFS) profile domain-containing protein n=1 Tax=Vitrella brassicaformis (strain CCMP3155) TaxID=1169540 RepID=A0A0G4EDX8_VITBC|nr:unnamed protein product [Vitrella brassicaformis CCMP3155]|eukprot:CEL93765.1 unnamed protein product [Vitrella brassicaformis CCMP3155]
MADTCTTTDRVRSFVARSAHTLDHFKQPDFAAAHVCLLLFVLALNLPITVVGYLRSAAFGVQIPGAIIFGILCDTYGSRFGFLLAFASCILSFLTTAAAIGQWMLYLSVVLSFFMHGLQVSSQVVSLRTSASERAFHLGLLTLSYGIGLVIGGLAGGFIALELRSNRMAALFSVVLSGAALVVSQLAIPAIVPTSGERYETATEIFGRAALLLKDTLKHTKSSLLLLFFFLGFAIVTSLVNPSALNFVAIMSLMTTRVTENEVATVIGLNDASFTLLNTICPSLGLWLYSIAGLHAVFLLCLVWSGVVAVVFGVPSALYPKSYPLLSALDAHPPE